MKLNYKMYRFAAILMTQFLIMPISNSQEVGMVIKFDRSLFSGSIGSMKLPHFTKAIQKAGYNCPKATSIESLGRGVFGETYLIQCGDVFKHEVSLGPGNNEVAVEPQNEESRSK